MKLYNSYTQQIEPFIKDDGTPVTLYVCGITPYDTTHLGHAFTYTVADILIRYLEDQGYAVRYVQNVTDIDDDILRKAKEVDDNWFELGNRWTSHFIKDMQRLNVRAPDVLPRATEAIAPIIDMVQTLIQHDLGYVAEGNVYYRVDGWSDFGQLSRIPRSEMLAVANERGNDADDPHKLDPLDFVLWQASAEGEPFWESPWGKGRPGWHIECSTLAAQFLGETIDIHMGGDDLIFPHHECEIAQIVPLTHKPFVRYWMHTAMVKKDGEKMSKSLGNLVMASDLLQEFSPNALRFYLAQHHYRQPWSYSKEQLVEAETLVHKIREATFAVSGEAESEVDVTTFQQDFANAMDADLDTSRALALIIDFCTEISDQAKRGKAVRPAQECLRRCCAIFGLHFGNSAPDVSRWSEHLKNFAVKDQK